MKITIPELCDTLRELPPPEYVNAPYYMMSVREQRPLKAPSAGASDPDDFRVLTFVKERVRPGKFVWVLDIPNG